MGQIGILLLSLCRMELENGPKMCSSRARDSDPLIGGRWSLATSDTGTMTYFYFYASPIIQIVLISQV